MLKYRYFFELYQNNNEFTQSLFDLISNMNNYGELSYVEPPNYFKKIILKNTTKLFKKAKYNRDEIGNKYRILFKL